MNISKLKKSKNYFSPNSKDNIFIYLVSCISFPISILIARIKIPPNAITCMSLIFGLTSIYYLFKNEYIFYVLFFILSIILDFNDGQVARINKKVNTSRFDLDLNVDLIKNCAVLLSVGIIDDKLDIWILTSICIFLYIYFLLSHLLLQNEKKISKFKFKNIKFYFFSQIKVLVFSVNAHTFFLLVFLPIDYIKKPLLFFFIFLFSINIVKNFYLLKQKKI